MKCRLLAAVLATSLVYSCGGPQNTESTNVAEKPAVAAEVDKTIYPEVTVPFEKFVLDNGLTVVVHEDHKAPLVAVNIWYHVGSKDEPVGKSGFAHLFEHLMFQGSENFKGEFFEPLEKAGAKDVNGTTNEDRTNYFETVPTPALDMALWMESDRMGHFAGSISQELLDEQRGVVQNEKRQYQNEPYGRIWEIVPPHAYPAGHPYSWSAIGSMDDLNAASLDDVKGWFGQYYGASNAVLVLAGDITVAEAREKAVKFFGDIPAGPATTKRGTWVAKMTERKELTIFDRVPQERVYHIYNLPPYGTKTFEHLRIATAALSEGKNSRLYKRLVYDEQLATNIDAYLFEGEIGGQLYLHVDARPGVSLAAVEAALDEEIARFAAEGPTMDELVRVKMNRFAKFVAGSQKVGGWGGKADLLAQHEVFFDDPGALERILGDYRAANPADVKGAASEWFTQGVLVMRILPEAKREVTEAGADRSKLPSAGPATNLELPEFQRTTLSNGVKVLLVERHAAPMLKVSALFEVGSAYDKTHKLGTAKLAMDLLDEGTESTSALELAAHLERLGASLETSALLDSSSVVLTTLTTTLQPSLDVFADVLLNPAFGAEEIERQRKRALATIAQEKAEPFNNALRTLGPILYGDAHVYGQPLTGSGTVESVGSINRDDLIAFKNAVIHPAHATIVVVGDTTMDVIKPELEARFGAWKGEGPPAKIVAGPLPRPTGVNVYLIDKPRAEQSLIITGDLLPPFEVETWFPITTMIQILGGTFTARLNMNLREDKHWSYGAGSFIVSTQLEQLLGTYAQVQTDKTSESMVEILKEVNDYLGARPATADELQKTKDNKTRMLAGNNETIAGLNNTVTNIVLTPLPDDYWSIYVKGINALTLGDVAASAKENLKPKQLTWIVIGDLSRIEEGVRALKLGKVTVLDAKGAPVK